MIELYKRYTLTTDKGLISPTGMVLIRSLISDQRATEGEWARLNPENTRAYLYHLPEAWQWIWNVERGEYRGKFATRVGQYYHKVMGLKCPESFISQIGNLARSHSEDQTAYEFEFVDRFDWEDGDYGDYGSCLWNEYEYGRDAMQDNGTWAVRFYDENENGIARAWFYTVTDTTDWYIIWNGTGFEQSTLVIARVVSQFLKFGYKKIRLTNYGTGSSAVYINGEIGYAIGTADILDKVDRYDLEFDIPYMERCANCDRMLHEDEIRYGSDDLPYCDDCYYDHFESCSYCGEPELQSEANTFDHHGDYVCERCLQHYYRQCGTCEEFYRQREMRQFEGRHYCPQCFDELRPNPLHWE